MIISPHMIIDIIPNLERSLVIASSSTGCGSKSSMIPTGAAVAVGPFSIPMFDSGCEACPLELDAMGVVCRLF